MTDRMIAKIGREIAKSNTLFSRLRQDMGIRTRTSAGDFLHDLIGVQPGDDQVFCRVFDAGDVNKSVFARCGSAIDRRHRQGIRMHFNFAQACLVTGMALFEIELGGRQSIIGCPVSGSRKCVDDVP